MSLSFIHTAIDNFERRVVVKVLVWKLGNGVLYCSNSDVLTNKDLNGSETKDLNGLETMCSLISKLPHSNVYLVVIAVPVCLRAGVTGFFLSVMCVCTIVLLCTRSTSFAVR